MPHSPKVSVVIAAYNQAEYLPQALDSVLAQDLGPDLVEVIVVDDGSTDATPDVLQRYATRTRRLTQAHQGLAAACNAGFVLARGKYVARVDSDDFVAPAWARRVVETLDHHPEACCVFPNYIQVGADGTRRPMPAQENNLYSLLACGTMFRMAAVRAIGGVRPLYWEEYDLYLRLRDHGAFLHLPEELYWYRQHASSMTAKTQARRLGWQELIRVWGSQRLLAAGSCSELDAAVVAEEAAA